MSHETDEVQMMDPSSKWWQTWVNRAVSVVHIELGLALWFGVGRWTSGRSLRVIRDYGHVPWPAVGAVLIAAAVMIMWPPTRIAGHVICLLAALAFIASSIIFSVIVGRGAITNVAVISLCQLSPLASMACIRYAVVERRRKP